MSKDELEHDTLFLAVTRPAMVGGVTMEGMGINVMLSCVLCLLLGSIRYAAVGIVIHIVFKALLRHDHNAFRVILAWIDTHGRSRNTSYWGGSSVSPLKLTRDYSPKDYGHV